jgi:hypothetical protein
MSKLPFMLQIEFSQQKKPPEKGGLMTSFALADEVS